MLFMAEVMALSVRKDSDEEGAFSSRIGAGTGTSVTAAMMDAGAEELGGEGEGSQLSSDERQVLTGEAIMTG